MRKWKIRTKMIAGLCGLALVIGLLVYNSWSQLSRDRYLPIEISQLADEIDYAFELNDSAQTLSAALIQIRQIKQDSETLNQTLIEKFNGPAHTSNSFVFFDAFELPNLRDTALDDIGSSLQRLNELLPDAPERVSERIAAMPSTTLIIDRDSQAKKLEAIVRCFETVQTNWEKLTELDQDSTARELQETTLNLTVDRLVQLTRDHYAAIQTGMRQFRDNVGTGQLAKQHRFWLYTSLSFLLIAFLFWQFWTLIVVPFRTLFRGSQLIASGHHKHKILLGTDDEIGLMADTVNDITDRFNRAVNSVTLAKQRAEQEVRDRTREVIQNEQLASVGFLAAGVAHEINNPLGAIAWSAEALEETLNDLPENEKEQFDQDFLSELQTNLGLIQSEAFRCKGITKRLLNFSRLSDSTRASEDIGDLVSRVVSMVGKVGEYRCKTIQVHSDEPVDAYCNSQEIQQVVLNLVSNALESVDTDGKVDVYVRNEVDPLSGVQQAVVAVEDDGCGMDQEVMNHLFEPFFTRRRDDSGTGLGLSISYRIVSLHHGSLTPHSDGEGCGSKMILRLPAQPADKMTQPVAPSAIQIDQSNSSAKWDDVQKVA